MTQTTRYASVLAKIGAEKSKLLTEARIKALVETKDLTSFVAQLRDTSYQAQIAKLPVPLTSRRLERAFNEALIEAYTKIVKNSPKKAAGFLSLYLLRLEIENIKTLIKTTNAGLSNEEKLSRIYFSVEDFLKNHALIEDAAKATTVRQAVTAFKGTQYASALGRGLQGYEEDGSTSAFDVLLDKLFYESLYEEYEELPRKEKSHAVFYVSTENDGFTLWTLLRGKVLNYDANWLRTAVPSKNFKLTSETIDAILTSSDFDSALKVALDSHYGKLFVKASTAEETLATAEKAFKKAVFQHAKTSTVQEIFNVGAPLAFMMLKQAEVRNLVAISSGVEAQVKTENIQSQLLL